MKRAQEGILLGLAAARAICDNQPQSRFLLQVGFDSLEEVVDASVERLHTLQERSARIPNHHDGAAAVSMRGAENLAVAIAPMGITEFVVEPAVLSRVG